MNRQSVSLGARQDAFFVRAARAAAPWTPALLFCSIFALALAARLHGLGAKPLWLDEVFTAQRSSLGVPTLVADSLSHRHSPLFFLAEHALASLASGAAGLRLIPALAGAMSAALVFAIGRAAGLTTGALLAALLAALAPLHVAFGQEARSYTLMLAFTLVALWGLVRLAAEPERAARPWREGGALPAAWAAYGFGTLAALLTLGDAAPWLITSNIAMLVAILPRVGARRHFLARWFGVQAAILLLSAPLYGAMLAAVHGQVMESFRWIPELTWRFVWRDVASLYGLRDATMVTMRLLPGPSPLLAPFALALGAVGILALRRERGARAVLLITVAGLPAVLILISPTHPVLLPRYLLWSAAPFFVLAGAAIEVLPRPARPLFLGLSLVLLMMNLRPYYHAETKPRWDLAAASLANRMTPSDIVLVADGAAPVMLTTYLDALGRGATPLVATRHRSKAEATLAAGGHVFVFYGPAGQGKLPPESPFFAKAGALGVAGPARPIGKEIVMEEINPPGTGIVVCDRTGTRPTN